MDLLGSKDAIKEAERVLDQKVTPQLQALEAKMDRLIGLVETVLSKRVVATVEFLDKE